MPYIGRNHIAGDHTSNFKVLDDISSYTATFNGSLATIISTADETIRIPEHRFIQGQRVTYSNGGGGNIGGLTNGTAYFVTFDTANTFKLATSLANANNNTNINLSSVGSGSSHTLTAAFDGVNQNFKATHSGGSDVRINNSTQLQIAINNVIQKPNNNSSYTEGFRVVDREKIQFKTAPTSNDVFWGTVISNTIETFDISDYKVDNFTGDGSTTEFNLSSAPPNNNSIIVTINGVVQHPSDAASARAYSLTNQSIVFTSAPANGDEIQVRHIGFAGAATAAVSGFYGRTGNVVLGASDNITTGNITPSNINASGIITASQFKGDGSQLSGIDATALKDTSGNVKIQAQASGAVHTGISSFATINVGSGVTLETNGQATYTGIVTALKFKGDGSELSNVISGVDLKFEGATVGTGATILNFVGFNTVTPPVSGLSTITSGQNLTIGVRSGSAVEASLTGTSFNVIARSGGNISINI